MKHFKYLPQPQPLCSSDMRNMQHQKQMDMYIFATVKRKKSKDISLYSWITQPALADEILVSDKG